MKLERYKDKKETRKKVMLIGLTVVTIVSVAMMLYKTFANFRTSTSFQIMSGKVVFKKKGLELGKDIKPGSDSSGNGLFAVTPPGPSGWTQTEYRYAGPNPNNYVYFNCSDISNQADSTCEKWRIIGKVNVKTSSGGIEQRLKIIRNESIGNYAWSMTSDYYNNWTKSTLKDMLNEGYYFSLPNVTCYKGSNLTPANKSTCDFSSNNPKGLTSLARDMIDNQVIWNLGGWDTGGVTTDTMYEKERGVKTYNDQPAEWTTENDSSHEHRGVGLMYPSDYGYAVGGNDIREGCLTTNLSYYNYGGCSINDWLTPIEEYEWTIVPNSVGINGIFIIYKNGFVDYNYNGWFVASLRPVVYLYSNIKIGEGEGTQLTPFHLVVG